MKSSAPGRPAGWPRGWGWGHSPRTTWSGGHPAAGAPAGARQGPAAPAWPAAAPAGPATWPGCTPPPAAPAAPPATPASCSAGRPCRRAGGAGREGSGGSQQGGEGGGGCCRWDLSPLPGVDGLLLVPEFSLQLSDRLLPAKHHLVDCSQLIGHCSEPVPGGRAGLEPPLRRPCRARQSPPRACHPRVLHALHRQLIQLQLPRLQGLALLQQRLIKGDAGWDVRGGPGEGGTGPGQGTGQQIRCRAGARRGLPVLPQEAVVLGLGLDASSGCSHLLVNGRHLFMHQAADLQVFLQDLLPAPRRQDPGSAGPRAGARLGSWGPDSGLGVSGGVEPPPPR